MLGLARPVYLPCEVCLIPNLYEAFCNTARMYAGLKMFSDQAGLRVRNRKREIVPALLVGA